MQRVRLDPADATSPEQVVSEIAWADHVVLWGGTQLGHRVSTLYSGSAHCSTVMKRSVQGLWEHLAEAARLAAERGPR